MFLGSFKYSIDSKGRVSIPAKLRKFVSPEANDGFVMTRGTEKCIEVHPMDEWKLLADEKLEKLNTFNPQEALFLRMFLAEAGEDKLDTQSRLLLPKNLIKHAELEREVVIIGAMKKIEIWNPKNYDSYVSGTDLSFAEVAEKVMSKNNDVKE